MATGTRSLPPDSPVPYFQQVSPERGQVSEGVPSDMDLPMGALHMTQNIQIPPRCTNSDILPYLPSSGTEYDQRSVDQDKMSTYTSLDDYDALFEPRHGRGAVDNVTITSEKVSAISPVMVPTSATNKGITENTMTGARPKHTPGSGYPHPSQKGHVSVEEEYRSSSEHDAATPVGVGHILGEGATIFTDMTETMLANLDEQMALPDAVQKPESSSLNNPLASGPTSSQSDIKPKVPDVSAYLPNTSSISTQEPKSMPISTTKEEDKYPDLYLPVAENYRISNKFCGYMESMSTDNNPMVLVELTGLSYSYGPTIHAVDRVNGTMYGRYSRGFRMISERATTEPQYRVASLAGMYGHVQPMHMSTLPEMTQMVMPPAESTPMTQSLQVPVIPKRIPPVRDVLELISNEQARANYLKTQMTQMSSVSGLSSDKPPLEDISTKRQDNLQKRVHDYCQENRVKKNRNGNLTEWLWIG